MFTKAEDVRCKAIVIFYTRSFATKLKTHYYNVCTSGEISIEISFKL